MSSDPRTAEDEKRIEDEVELRWQAILAGGDEDSDVLIIDLPDLGVSGV